MKTVKILFVAASLSTLATAAFASSMPQDDVDRQIRIGIVNASNDNPTPAGPYSQPSPERQGTLDNQPSYEGRQARRLYRHHVRTYDGTYEGRQAAPVDTVDEPSYGTAPLSDAERYIISRDQIGEHER